MAISNEEEAARAYTEFAESLRNDYPDSARMFTDMALEETEHRHRLIDLFRTKFGETIPAIRADDVRGVTQERPAGLAVALGAEAMRRQARQMEVNASRFYHLAASRTQDATIRNVLGDLAVAEAAHEKTADEMDESTPPTEGRVQEVEDARKRFVLADHPAGPGRADGRFGQHAGAGVRGGVRDALVLERLPGGAGGEHRGGDQHGVRGGAGR